MIHAALLSGFYIMFKVKVTAINFTRIKGGIDVLSNDTTLINM